MSKWMIKGDDGPHNFTIIDAISENAAMQIARDTFGPAATWKELTDEQAASMARFMEGMDDLKDQMGQLGKHANAMLARTKSEYNMPDVPERVFDVLGGMALWCCNWGLGEPWEPPYPDVLRNVLAMAKTPKEWAWCIAQLQRMIWEGDHEGGVIGFDQVCGVANDEDDMMEALAEIYMVPDEHRVTVATTMKLLGGAAEEHRMTVARTYCYVLKLIAAACDFDLTDEF